METKSNIDSAGVERGECEVVVVVGWVGGDMRKTHLLSLDRKIHI